ncbi:hypothetical protein ACWDRS_08695, partial [Streptomyces griseus]
MSLGRRPGDPRAVPPGDRPQRKYTAERRRGRCPRSDVVRRRPAASDTAARAEERTGGRGALNFLEEVDAQDIAADT